MPDPPAIHFAPQTSADAPTRALAAMAWLAAAFALGAAAMTWTSGRDATAAMFYLGLGSGAAYLAMALPRRITSAWRACRELASAIGTIHLVVLPSLAIGWAIALAMGAWGGWDISPAQRTQALAAAGAATALPWAFYYALGDARVRSWFCVADYHEGSGLSQ